MNLTWKLLNLLNCMCQIIAMASYNPTENSTLQVGPEKRYQFANIVKQTWNRRIQTRFSWVLICKQAYIVPWSCFNFMTFFGCMSFFTVLHKQITLHHRENEVLYGIPRQLRITTRTDNRHRILPVLASYGNGSKRSNPDIWYRCRVTLPAAVLSMPPQWQSYST